MKVGDKFKIDRFNDGDILEWRVKRICKKHIIVTCHTFTWAMLNNRLKDIIQEIKT